MSSEQGVMIIGPDTGLKGQVRRCHRLEIRGAFEGDIEAGTVVVHRGGRCLGSLKVDSAEVHGNLEGTVRVRNLISIRSTGSVVGNVQYGSLALEPGGELSAEVRNVPPTVSGDFKLEVKRGRAVRVTLEDLTALDPDDTAEALRFAVAGLAAGSIVLAGSPSRSASAFTQADLAAGHVQFLHDGSAGPEASFDVIVTDSRGATSGAPRTVMVAVV